jgi:hypothetical protein
MIYLKNLKIVQALKIIENAGLGTHLSSGLLSLPFVFAQAPEGLMQEKTCPGSPIKALVFFSKQAHILIIRICGKRVLSSSFGFRHGNCLHRRA